MPWKKMLAWAAGQIKPLLLQKLEFVLALYCSLCSSCAAAVSDVAFDYDDCHK
jgi:hypothetical protein